MNKPLLSSIQSLPHLKALPRDQLIPLAGEIRQEIIDVMAINGGHLGSNMGIVELTIALHRIFSSPQDNCPFSNLNYLVNIVHNKDDRHFVTL